MIIKQLLGSPYSLGCNSLEASNQNSELYNTNTTPILKQLKHNNNNNNKYCPLSISHCPPELTWRHERRRQSNDSSHQRRVKLRVHEQTSCNHTTLEWEIPQHHTWTRTQHSLVSLYLPWNAQWGQQTVGVASHACTKTGLAWCILWEILEEKNKKNWVHRLIFHYASVLIYS